jgi:hypothetical protein
MREVRIAEFLLCRVMSRERAAALVGDLIESPEHQHVMRFWRCIAGVLFRYGWRSALGLIAGFFVTMRVSSALQMAIFGVHTQHRPDYPWDQFLLVPIGLVGMMLAGNFAYSSVKYGVRDRCGQACFGVFAIAAAVTYLWWMPAVVWGSASCMAVAFLAALLHRDGRRLAVVLSVDTVTAVAAYLLALFAATRYQHWLVNGPVGDVQLREHPSINIVSLLALLCWFWACTRIWSRMHAWLERGTPVTN